jgi:GNAT superfamily N-acetyltransferase
MTTEVVAVALREARPVDVPVLERLIAESARALSRPDYTDAQIEAALGTAWGVDSELIRDGTYFVAEVAEAIIACGGWSRRKTLFGGDRQAGRQSELLDPSRDAARIRAFFVRPDWARRGVGRVLLERCEAEALAQGFRSAELLATLPGRRLYAAFGYAGGERVAYPLPGGITIDFVPMKKSLQ